MNKILYCVILFFIPWLGKFLNGRTVPGVVQLILWFFFIGSLIGLIEMIFVIIKNKADENGEITIPSGFFDFL
jgi:TM2 domain-containing membrane protein YozV